MKFLKDLKLGYVSYIDAVKFIKKHKLWYYFIFPVLLFLGIYYLGFVFQELKGETVIEDDMGLIKKIWLMFLRSLYALLSFAMFSLMRYVLLMVMSPILSIISERVEMILTGNKYKFNLKQLIKDINRALNLAIRNLVWELAIAYGLILVYYFVAWMVGFNETVDSVFTTLIIAVVGFYYYGFGFIDYIMERMRMNLKESIVFVRKNKGFAVALGSVFMIIFIYSNEYLMKIREDISDGWLFVFVIILSIILAMIPIVTLVAATLGVHQIVDLKNNPYAIKEEEKPAKEEPMVEPEEAESPEVEKEEEIEIEEDTSSGEDISPSDESENSDDEIVE